MILSCHRVYYSHTYTSTCYFPLCCFWPSTSLSSTNTSVKFRGWRARGREEYIQVKPSSIYIHDEDGLDRFQNAAAQASLGLCRLTKEIQLDLFETFATERRMLIVIAAPQHIPQVGFGLWKVPPEQTSNAVYSAIRAGYRHIDGAYGYKNSVEAGEGVRRAVKEGLVSRSDLFITSKLWNNYHARQHAVEMAHVETEAWGLDYLDLFLIHFPIAQQYIPLSETRFPGWYVDAAQSRVTPRARVPMFETWQALESLVAPGPPGRNADGGLNGSSSGFLRSIGVSNVDAQLLYDLVSYARVLPSILQVEHHPYLGQANLLRAAQDAGVRVTAYSTFGPQSFFELDNPRARGVVPLLEAEPVVAAANRLGRTPAQVLLRWCTQRGVVVIPKSMRLERMAENLDCCSFDLLEEEMGAISALDRGLRFNDPGMTHGSPLHIFS